MAQEMPHDRLYAEIVRFAKSAGYLGEDWFIGDFVISASMISPLERNRGMTGYVTINPDHQAPHSTLGLLNHASARLNHSMNQEMDDNE